MKADFSRMRRGHVAWATLAAFFLLISNSSFAQDGETHSRAVGGLMVYYGVVPAAIVRDHPATHAEAVMHRGVPSAGNEFHLVVAVFDSITGARISNANVTATVFGPGNVLLYGQSEMRRWATQPLTTVPAKPLEPMTIGQTVTYGGYFILPKSALYTFQFTIALPNRSRPVVVAFQHDLQND